jgi:hypothetical protein
VATPLVGGIYLWGTQQVVAIVDYGKMNFEARMGENFSVEIFRQSYDNIQTIQTRQRQSEHGADAVAMP